MKTKNLKKNKTDTPQTQDKPQSKTAPKLVVKNDEQKEDMSRTLPKGIQPDKKARDKLANQVKLTTRDEKNSTTSDGFSFKNLKIKSKMSLLLGMVLVIILINSGVGVWGVTKVKQEAKKIEDLAELLDKTQEVRLAIQQLIMPANDFLIPGADPNEERNFEGLLQNANQRYNAFVEYLDTHPSVGVHATHKTPKGELIIDDIKTDIEHIEEWSRQIFEIANAPKHAQLTQMLAQEKMSAISVVEQMTKYDQELLAAGALMEKIDTEADDIISEMTEIIGHIEEDEHKAFVSSEQTKNTVMITMLITFITSLALLGMMLLIIFRLIINPLSKLSLITQKIGQGDLNARAEVESKDEIGILARSFNQMTDNLLQAINYIRGIIKTMPTALIVMDDKGKIKTINEATCRMLGYEEKELLGKDIRTIFTTTTTTTTTTIALLKSLGLESLAKEKHVDNVRAYLKSKKGESIPINLSAGLLFSGEEKITSIVFVAKDLRELAEYAKQRLSEITPVLQKIATGDFSQKIEIPKEEDEFTEHLVALNLMIDDFREMVEEIKQKQEEMEAQNEELEETSAELEEAKTSLEEKVQERTAELEKAKTGLEAQVAERTKELSELNKNLEQEVAKRTKELQAKVLELERFNKVAVGRELKMVELKEEIAQLKGERMSNKDVVTNPKKKNE